MSVLTRSNAKHVRRAAAFAIILAPAIYFAPIPVAVFLACGVLDVGRGAMQVDSAARDSLDA